MFNAGRQIFREIAPIPKGELSSGISTNNLYSDLNPETFYFRLDVIEGHTELVQTPPPRPQLNSFHLDIKDTTLDLPRYSSRDITVRSKLMGSGYIGEVMICGLDMCCKIATAQSTKAGRLHSLTESSESQR